MSDLAALQDAFQRCLLEPGSRSPLTWVAAGGCAPATRQVGAYVYAYRARLAEALAGDFPAVSRALGAAAFERVARNYAAACPSRSPNLRDFGTGFPAWLATQPECRSTPWLAELGQLEWALGLAFDAADGPVATVQRLADLPPAHWPGLRLAWHASVQRLDLAWNTPELRDALCAEPAQPLQATPGSSIPWLVWRQGLVTRFRALPPDEAAALDVMRSGADFASACDRLAASLPADTVPLRAAGLLKTWLTQGLVADLYPGA